MYGYYIQNIEHLCIHLHLFTWFSLFSRVVSFLKDLAVGVSWWALFSSIFSFSFFSLDSSSFNSRMMSGVDSLIESVIPAFVDLPLSRSSSCSKANCLGLEKLTSEPASEKDFSLLLKCTCSLSLLKSTSKMSGKTSWV